MSKANPLVSLIGHYGDSDDDSEEEMSRSSKMRTDLHGKDTVQPEMMASDSAAAMIHPAPVQHCPWSACYDESSGFTYYWNQYTNAVTWEAPPEYLMALKLAQQQLSVKGSTEVSAEEWLLYQQALAEKQTTKTKVVSKPLGNKKTKAPENKTNTKNNKNVKNGNAVKRKANSDSEDEKIELITSYCHSDSESNDEADSPAKKPPLPAPVTSKPPPTPKPATPSTKPVKPIKKQKPKQQPVEFGPPLPPNQNYTVPIGPELPPEMLIEPKAKSPEVPKIEIKKYKEVPKEPVTIENEDEHELLKKLKDKTKLLEKLGGEIPTEIQKIITDENSSDSPQNLDESSQNSKSTLNTNIDDLLDEIEKKELPKIVKSKIQIDMFGDDNVSIKDNESAASTPKELSRCNTPSTDDIKPLFPSNKPVENSPKILFPSAANIEEKPTEPEVKPAIIDIVAEKKGSNIYLMDSNASVEKPSRKKLRISNSVLPERKTNDVPAYTTKYSQVIDGFSGERTGLGFSKLDDEETESPKRKFAYGKGLMFTKGETLHEEKKDEATEEMIDLLEAKLKFLNQQQVYNVSPVQEMTIQMQTLVAAHKSAALSLVYLRRWLDAAAASLSRLEHSAAPPGWTCRFNRSEERYVYQRDSDGLTQWEYPAVSDADDMDICTTPPHSSHDDKMETPPPPCPPVMPPCPPPPPVTPPPPVWQDPAPPGCEEISPSYEQKKEIGDELLSFYKDIAQLDKVSPSASSSNSPERCKDAEPSLPTEPKKIEHVAEKNELSKCTKKKSKVKISSTMGLKQNKTVSTLVAKWQQVAEEINSD